VTIEQEFSYKIGIIGPSRVGKTSLITALLRDGQRLLEGTPIELKAQGTPTQQKIARQQRELQGELLAGEFNPGSLSGTDNPFTFELMLDPGVKGAGIRLQLLDYPGAWLDPGQRHPQNHAAWFDCEQFIVQSGVLLVPIDASVLMEAIEGRHKRALPSILLTDQVEEVARSWSKARVHSGEPGLMLVCPVKCESYFADNGGRVDDNARLLQVVRAVYEGVFDVVRGESRKDDAPRIDLVYCPVDTIGCVEIKHASWNPHTGGELGGWEFSAEYAVRYPPRIRPKGVDDVLGSLFRHLIEARKQVAAEAARDAGAQAIEARLLAQRREGFFKDIWLRLNGERALREVYAKDRSAEARHAANRVEELNNVVSDVAKRAPSARVRDL
jgi:hypothetical protein